MIVGVGRSPLANFIIKYLPDLVGTIFYPYPMFFDDKKNLLEGRVKEYVERLWKNSHSVKIALYPDYQDERLHLPKGITYVYPVHSLNEYEKFQRVKRKYGDVYAGYASSEKYRDYTLCEFLKAFKNEKLWYLGVSTKRELREAINFDAMDITGFLFGNNEDRTNKEKLIKNIMEFVEKIRIHKKNLVCQSTIFDFF